MAIPAISNNTPTAGSIAWDAFHIQLYGIPYNVAASSTDQKWVWWKYNAGSPTIETGATIPVDLADDDLVLFANRNGIGARVQATNFIDGELLVDGSIFAEALSANLISTNHIVTAGLSASVIKFGEMSGDRIAANTIAANKIVSHSITANEILADTITANEIATDTITANEMAADSVTARNILAGSITTEKIETGSIVSDHIESGQIQAQHLAVDAVSAGFVLAGQIKVGDITIDPTFGITIPSASGTTRLSSDGSGNVFAGQGSFDALDVRGDLDIGGFDNTLSSSLLMIDSIREPSRKLLVEPDYDFVGFAGGENGFYRRGLDEYDATTWVCTDSLLAYNDGVVQIFGKDGNPSAITHSSIATGWAPIGGVTKIGAVLYVLAKDSGNNYKVFAFVQSGSALVRQSSLDSPVLFGNVPKGHPIIGKSLNGNVLIAFSHSLAPGTLSIWRYNVTDWGATMPQYAASSIPVLSTVALTSVTEYAPNKFQVTWEPSATHTCYSLSGTTLTRIAADEFPVAKTGWSRGVCYVNSKWHMMSSEGFYDYTNLPGGTMKLGYSWVDSNPAGSGTAETTMFEADYSGIVKYAKLSLSLPVSPPRDSVDNTPIEAYIYARPNGNANPAVKQGTILQAETPLVLDSLLTSGKAPSPTNGFNGRGGLGGSLVSGAESEPGDPIIRLTSGGSGRVGPLDWNESGLPVSFQQSISGSGSFTTPSGTVTSRPVGLCEGLFVAPKSGRVTIDSSAYIRSGTAGQACILTVEVVAGGNRSGPVVHPSNLYDGCANYGTALIRGHGISYVDDLIPGEGYYVYPVIYSTAPGGYATNFQIKIIPRI